VKCPQRRAGSVNSRTTAAGMRACATSACRSGCWSVIALGSTGENLLRFYPDLTPADLEAAWNYAAARAVGGRVARPRSPDAPAIAALAGASGERGRATHLRNALTRRKLTRLFGPMRKGKPVLWGEARAQEFLSLSVRMSTRRDPNQSYNSRKAPDFSDILVATLTQFLL